MSLLEPGSAPCFFPFIGFADISTPVSVDSLRSLPTEEDPSATAAADAPAAAGAASFLARRRMNTMTPLRTTRRMSATAMKIAARMITAR